MWGAAISLNGVHKHKWIIPMSKAHECSKNKHFKAKVFIFLHLQELAS